MTVGLRRSSGGTLMRFTQTGFVSGAVARRPRRRLERVLRAARGLSRRGGLTAGSARGEVGRQRGGEAGGFLGEREDGARPPGGGEVEGRRATWPGIGLPPLRTGLAVGEETSSAQCSRIAIARWPSTAAAAAAAVEGTRGDDERVSAGSRHGSRRGSGRGRGGASCRRSSPGIAASRPRASRPRGASRAGPKRPWPLSGSIVGSKRGALGEAGPSPSAPERGLMTVTRAVVRARVGIARRCGRWRRCRRRRRARASDRVAAEPFEQRRDRGRSVAAGTACWATPAGRWWRRWTREAAARRPSSGRSCGARSGRRSPRDRPVGEPHQPAKVARRAPGRSGSSGRRASAGRDAGRKAAAGGGSRDAPRPRRRCHERASAMVPQTTGRRTREADAGSDARRADRRTARSVRAAWRAASPEAASRSTKAWAAENRGRRSFGITVCSFGMVRAWRVAPSAGSRPGRRRRSRLARISELRRPLAEARL